MYCLLVVSTLPMATRLVYNTWEAIVLFAEGYAKNVVKRRRRRNPGCDFTETRELSGFVWFFLNLRTAPNWHMWQRACVCFLYLRLYRDWILGVQILLEKERLKTTEFRKTWRQEGKDPTKPKFPNKLFQEQRESVRERKICVAHPSSLDCILLALWNEAVLSRIPELGTIPLLLEQTSNDL